MLCFKQNCDSGKYVFDLCNHLWLLADAQERVLELVLEKLAQHLQRAFLLRFLEHGCDGGVTLWGADATNELDGIVHGLVELLVEIARLQQRRDWVPQSYFEVLGLGV